ncbi:MAG: alanine racemase [Bacilli bacterium]|nr:alanine racemase [Bacilli bacterium]
MYRKTYAEINLNNIKDNVQMLINNLQDYDYHIGVVKADCYGHNSNEVVGKIIEGGCNYLAVATLEEALEIRKAYREIPILCLGVIDTLDLNVCRENNITISISSLSYLNLIHIEDLNNIKVHLKINTGMNRLGISSNDELNKVYQLLKVNNIFIEGIYTHIYNDSSLMDTEKQIKKFELITSNINLEDIPIVHFGASGYTLNYEKLEYVNGCRLGIAMYGLVKTKLDLKSTFSLYSTVIQINDVTDETVGYNGQYRVFGNGKIAVIPIGYADGIIRKNTGRYVYINDKKYPIVGNICMDMLFIKVDDTIRIGDKVTLIKDNKHINEIAKHLDTINYEVICSVGKRIPRVYVK